jgi:hypothetical protein
LVCGGLPPLSLPRLAAAASCRVESGAKAPHSKGVQKILQLAMVPLATIHT